MKSGQCGARGQRPCTDAEAESACEGAQVEIENICQLPFDRKITILSNEGLFTPAPYRFARATSRQRVTVAPIDGMTEFDATDATFVRRRGLADRRCASFESLRFPGCFLAASDGATTVTLQQRRLLELPGSNQTPFSRRATFCLRTPNGASRPVYEVMSRPTFFLAAMTSALGLVELSGAQAQETNALAQIEERLGTATLALKFRGWKLNAIELDGLLVVPLVGECSPKLTMADVQDRLLGKPPRRTGVSVVLDNVTKGAPLFSKRVVTHSAQTAIGTRVSPVLTLHLALPKDLPESLAGQDLVARIGRSVLPCEGDWADEDVKKLLREQGLIP